MTRVVFIAPSSRRRRSGASIFFLHFYFCLCVAVSPTLTLATPLSLPTPSCPPSRPLSFPRSCSSSVPLSVLTKVSVCLSSVRAVHFYSHRQATPDPRPTPCPPVAPCSFVVVARLAAEGARSPDITEATGGSLRESGLVARGRGVARDEGDCDEIIARNRRGVAQLGTHKVRYRLPPPKTPPPRRSPCRSSRRSGLRSVRPRRRGCRHLCILQDTRIRGLGRWEI